MYLLISDSDGDDDDDDDDGDDDGDDDALFQPTPILDSMVPLDTPFSLTGSAGLSKTTFSERSERV